MSAIEYRTADSNGIPFTAESFLNALNPANSFWWEDGDNTSEWVFRGHGDSSWKLKPSAWRDRDEGNPLFDLIDQVKGLKFHPVITQKMQRSGISTIDREHPIYPWVNAEQEALFQFAELGNRLGFDVEPDDISPLKSRHMFTGGLVFESKNPNIAIAQHHGIPTRYLDFTFDPILATYHASVYSKTMDTQPDISIWAINKRNITNNIYHIQGKTPSQAYGSYQAISFKQSSAFNNPYLRAQAGVFLTIPFGDYIFYHERCWPDLEKLLQSSESEVPILIKFTLQSSHLTDLREILRRQGYSKARLMPTLDNVAETVKDTWFASS